jgi:putative PIN family toxin of toxin-antitoxin system
LIRAVIDTNILVSALIKPQGVVGPVLQRLRAGVYTLLYSEPLLAELVDVLARPRIRKKYHLGDEDVATVLALIMLRGAAVTPNRRIAVCRDPKDNQVLEVAVAGAADAIVSGDEDLLIRNPFENIPVLRPTAFLALLEQS